MYFICCLLARAPAADITISAQVSFRNLGVNNDIDLTSQLRRIRDTNVHIILVAVTNIEIVTVLRQMAAMGLTQAPFQIVGVWHWLRREVCMHEFPCLLFMT